MRDNTTWHPVSLSASVEPETAASVHLFGRELVAWRDGSGRAHVWEDRCPHRGMRLSLGFVRDDRLACLYHGWQYDATGRCRFVPAHPDLDVPATITVPVFRTREWAGIIWATFDESRDGAVAENTLETTAIRSIYVEQPLLRALALLFAFRVSAFDGSVNTTIKSLEQNLLQIDAGDDRMICALQTVSETRTGLHVTLAGTAPAARLHHYATEFEALRHRMEAAAAEIGAMTGV